MAQYLIVRALDENGNYLDGHCKIEIATCAGPKAGTIEQATMNGIGALLEMFGDRMNTFEVEAVES